MRYVACRCVCFQADFLCLWYALQFAGHKASLICTTRSCPAKDLVRARISVGVVHATVHVSPCVVIMAQVIKAAPWLVEGDEWVTFLWGRVRNRINNRKKGASKSLVSAASTLCLGP